MECDNYRNLGREVCDIYLGKRIDKYLGDKFLFLSRNEWAKRLKKNEVFVNGKPVKSSYKLRNNDAVSYFCPAAKEPEVNRNIEVIWEKSGVVAVNKPPNLPMHEGGRYRKNTFCEIIKSILGPQWASVHRLDRETSGIVLCAQSPDLRNALSAELRNRTMQKIYFAIVHGVPSCSSFVSEELLGETKNTLFRVKNWVIPQGLPSKTLFSIIESKNNFSLLKVVPKTGRTHQIRIHSSYAGFHLVGDKKYHPDESIFLDYIDHGFTERVKDAVKFDRLCLHASFLSFKHPLTNELCEIDSPMPNDMKMIWDSLKSDFKI